MGLYLARFFPSRPKIVRFLGEGEGEEEEDKNVRLIKILSEYHFNLIFYRKAAGLDWNSLVLGLAIPAFGGRLIEHGSVAALILEL